MNYTVTIYVLIAMMNSYKPQLDNYHKTIINN